MTHVAEVFDSRAVILLPDANGRLRLPDGLPLASSLPGADLSIAQWVADHGQRAGLGSDTLPAAPALYLPLLGSHTTLGVLAVQAANRRRVLLPEQRHLLETFAGQIALALERVQLAACRGIRRGSRRKRRACAIPSSPRSRTTCARRSR